MPSSFWLQFPTTDTLSVSRILVPALLPTTVGTQARLLSLLPEAISELLERHLLCSPEDLHYVSCKPFPNLSVGVEGPPFCR